MFHVNDKDEAKTCRAKSPENCRFYHGDTDARHYETVEEAQQFIEQKLEQEFGNIKADKKPRYSFMKNFKEQEEKFNTDFEGIPNRFFNYDLRDKGVNHNATYEQLIQGDAGVSYNNLINRLISGVSQPSDNKMNDNEVQALFDKEGYTEVEPITAVDILSNLKANRAWKVKIDDKDAIIIDGNSGTRFNARFAFRKGNDYFKAGKFWNKLDLRKVAGNSRIKNKSKVDFIRDITNSEKSREEAATYNKRMSALRNVIEADETLTEEEKAKRLFYVGRVPYSNIKAIHALKTLEEAQLEGKNFLSQKKYIKEHSGSIATAYMDKKNPDKIHEDLMKNNALNTYFRNVEIDNDVDPHEFDDFTQDYQEVRDKLPKIPTGQEPELRIRKLGKHKATGIYFPHKNTVCIDVHTSGSFVHEMAHQYDLEVKGNASLKEGFRDVAKEYSETLQVPYGEPKSRYEYLTTPTEILARGFELYAHEKLGIKNRLLDSNKLSNYDYEPFNNNPELKEKTFKFMESLYDNK